MQEAASEFPVKEVTRSACWVVPVGQSVQELSPEEEYVDVGHVKQDVAVVLLEY